MANARQAIGVSSAAFTAMISQAMNKFGGQTMQALDVTLLYMPPCTYHAISMHPTKIQKVLEALIPVTTMWPITSRRVPAPKVQSFARLHKCPCQVMSTLQTAGCCQVQNWGWWTHGQLWSAAHSPAQGQIMSCFVMTWGIVKTVQACSSQLWHLLVKRFRKWWCLSIRMCRSAWSRTALLPNLLCQSTPVFPDWLEVFCHPASWCRNSDIAQYGKFVSHVKVEGLLQLQAIASPRPSKCSQGLAMAEDWCGLENDEESRLPFLFGDWHEAAWYFVDKFGLASHIPGQFQMHNQAAKEGPWVRSNVRLFSTGTGLPLCGSATGALWPTNPQASQRMVELAACQKPFCGSVPLKKWSSLQGVQADQLPHWESSRYWRIAGSLLRHKFTTLDFLWKQSSPQARAAVPYFQSCWGGASKEANCVASFLFSSCCRLRVEMLISCWYLTFAFERLECPTTGCIPWQESSFWGQMRHVICCFLLWQTKSENADLLVLSYPVWIWIRNVEFGTPERASGGHTEGQECLSSCNVTGTKSHPVKIETSTLLVLQKLCGKGRDTEGTGTTFNKGCA